MNKSYHSLLFVMGGCLLLSLLYCPPFDMFYDDKEIFRYTGLVIRNGGVPYRDFFDHKPPLIFFLNAAGLLLGSWGLWLIDTFLVLLATLLFFDLAKKYRLPYPWLAPLFFNLILRNYLFCEGIGMTREYTAIFLLIAFSLILGKYRYRYFLLGTLSALTFFMQQDQLIPLLPFLLYALLEDDRISSRPDNRISSGPKNRVHGLNNPGTRINNPIPGLANRPPILKRIGWIAAGSLAITLPILCYFGLHHSLRIFWEDAFLFNFTWYTKEIHSLADRFRAVKTSLDAMNMELAFLIPATLGVSSLFLRHNRKGLLAAAQAGLLLSFTSEFISGKLLSRDFYYYLLNLSASLSILFFVIVAFSEEIVIRDKISQRIYGFLLCCSLGYNALQHATHLSRHNADRVTTSPEFKYLNEHRPGNYQLYVFGTADFNYTYNAFRILAPSRWIYHHFWFWYDRWDADQALLQSIGQDLLQHHTTYIMDFGAAYRFRNPANYAWWHSFLEKYYQPVELKDATTTVLWKIKDTPLSQDR